VSRIHRPFRAFIPPSDPLSSPWCLNKVRTINARPRLLGGVDIISLPFLVLPLQFRHPVLFPAAGCCRRCGHAVGRSLQDEPHCCVTVSPMDSRLKLKLISLARSDCTLILLTQPQASREYIGGSLVTVSLESVEPATKLSGFKQQFSFQISPRWAK
jgi:hypothetical protein